MYGEMPGKGIAAAFGAFVLTILILSRFSQNLQETLGRWIVTNSNAIVALRDSDAWKAAK